ncbi:MAG: ferritin [Cyanobacteriota bacterium]|nr:ferritin [Cyanobacteriota bacterium]
MVQSGIAGAPGPALSTGPAGRAVAQPMEPDLLTALQQHLSMERQAHIAYTALALWTTERELRGFAQHFKQEAADELQHAAMVADYLVARGQSVTLEALPAPRQQWQNCTEILAAVFAMEAEVTTSLQQLYALAERSGDVRTTVFLDPIIQGQIDAEHQAAHLLGRVRLADGNPAALLLIDGELSAGQSQPATLA